jgi:nitrogen fixation-related uncharacterized protein
MKKSYLIFAVPVLMAAITLAALLWFFLTPQ